MGFYFGAQLLKNMLKILTFFTANLQANGA